MRIRHPLRPDGTPCTTMDSFPPPPPVQAKTSLGLAAFLTDTTAPPKRATRNYMDPLQAAVLDATARAKSGEWEDAKPIAFIGLYVVCFRRVYGFDPPKLDRIELGHACRAFTKLALWIGDEPKLRRFGHPHDVAVRCFQWKWQDAKRYMTWCREHDRTVKPMGWRLLVSQTVFAEFRANVLERGPR